MAINRAPFNALVDDDGTNTVGTVWGKQDIKDVILDPVDAAILPPVPATWALQWTLFGGSGLALGNGTILTNYTQEGKRIAFSFSISMGSTTNYTGSGAGFYAFTLPVLCVDPQQVNLVASLWNAGGASVIPATGLAFSTSLFNIITTNGQPIGPTVPATWWGAAARIQVNGSYFAS
jgi:hypothetical protein